MQIFLQWLTTVSASAGGPEQSFQASWQYVAAALLIPAGIGLVAAGIILVMEKISGIRLGGGGV